MRKPGGFDTFYEFLDMISSQERLFITTWNLHSWRYLNEAFGIERYFPVQVFIPDFNKENLNPLSSKGMEKKRSDFITLKHLILFVFWLQARPEV
ncbi:MAG TPA: hypothetical protein VN429_12190 [Methanospirillum sp.]|uniref:hypothetical protein n=1 Tax=Methanospirillum sp. TaxID=45200 RepID=UPI002C727B8F|nr:hypothetical protein [Methanospirillum sp.]HWQ65171.1 hypothetical protein [Methanospirillum sp.]